MAFNQLIGQEKVKSILIDGAVSERLGHAYMFLGPEGIGKKTFSEEFAKLVMCMGRGEREDSYCDNCESCRLLSQGFNPDCLIVDIPQGKAVISVDAVREIQEQLTTAPSYGKKKIIIVRNADKMTSQAQNAFLKTLEEPPEYVVIILLVENRNLMLDTVKSRVITVEFGRNTDKEISDYYIDKYGIKDEAGKNDRLALVCAYCDGIIGRADKIGDGNESQKIREAIPDIIETILSNKYEASKKMNDLLKKNESAKSFVFFSLRSFYHDIQIASRYGSKNNMMNPDFREKISNLACKIGYHVADYNGNVVDETWRALGRNANLKLAVDRMIILLK